MKARKSYLKLTVTLSGIAMAGIVALILSSNASASNEEDYSRLKNGVELQSEILALNTTSADLKCGGDEGEKKCGEGDKDATEKSDKAKDGDKKCSEGKCGGDDGDKEAAAKSEKTAKGDKKCGEGDSKTE